MTAHEKARIEAWRSSGLSIVFTNGVFDILHAGHVSYLKAAKALGDKLIVGLNSDASARLQGKGPERPINKEADRKMVLEALRVVDAVIVFETETPLDLIVAVQPEVLVKGGDYNLGARRGEDGYIVGSKEVKERGGRVTVLPLLPGRSTTKILKKGQSQ
ncbi:MAG TPA: D-glycero-beta-D-manno-heptose 1-phosphate adenylyltransferase [Flavobacteriales bacterium]|nr:D-glycero-beta-D-manno-heptose 1-phosphate adenylyltransferase [Flavobacteriales bacterium]|tara:strand:+ start:2568 stop:3047 length:480 start_codon:yes stop_codon:yes gene_type:complete